MSIMKTLGGAAIVFLLTSCGFGPPTALYRIGYKDTPSLSQVTIGTDAYFTRVSRVPVSAGYTMEGGKIVYQETFTLGKEVPPGDILKEVQLFHNSVLLKTTFLQSSDFGRSEIQYPGYPKTVSFDYLIKLTDDEKMQLAELPSDQTIVQTSLGPGSVRLTWKPLQRNGSDATGIKYRAEILPVGTASQIVELDANDVDVLSKDFSGLLAGTTYYCSVSFGDLKGQLSHYPFVSLASQ